MEDGAFIPYIIAYPLLYLEETGISKTETLPQTSKDGFVQLGIELVCHLYKDSLDLQAMAWTFTRHRGACKRLTRRNINRLIYLVKSAFFWNDRLEP